MAEKKAPLVGPSLHGPGKEGPVVSVSMPELSLLRMRFSPVEHEAERHFHRLYMPSRKHGKAPGDLQGFARGDPFASEWVRKPGKFPRNLPFCYTRGSPVHIRLQFKAKGFKTEMPVTFLVKPRLDGKTGAFWPMTYLVLSGPGREFPREVVTLLGVLPDDKIGRMKLDLDFHCLTPGVFFHNAESRVRSEHHLFVTFDVPLDPKTGKATTVEEGSLTGTPVRLEKFVQLLGKTKQHRVSSKDLTELYWRIHEGINNNNPPFFHGGNDELLTVDAFPDFVKKPREEWPEDKFLGVEDQWLMWVGSKKETREVEIKGKKVVQRRHWNDASCIGHAQLEKTMVALFGLEGHLAWVFPHTTLLPLDGEDPSGQNKPGDTITFKDEDLFSVENHDNAKRQFWLFKAAVPDKAGKLRMRELFAFVALMHADASAWEHFEGCFRSPQGLFLTGGFPTSSNPESFRKNRGFRTAAELLNWWTGLKEGGRKRFLCWVTTDAETGFTWFFDRFGAIHSDPEEIRAAGRGLVWKP